MSININFVVVFIVFLICLPCFNCFDKYDNPKYDDPIYSCTHLIEINHKFVMYCNNTDITQSTSTPQNHAYDMRCYVISTGIEQINVSCLVSNYSTTFSVDGTCNLSRSVSRVIGYCHTIIYNTDTMYTFTVKIAMARISSIFLGLIISVVVILIICAAITLYIMMSYHTYRTLN